MADSNRMHISQFQQLISQKYQERDQKRGVPATFMWFIEEVGELATALANNDPKNKAQEFADVFAWLCTLANISSVDLEKACIDKYGGKNLEGFK
ncbi:MAG: MazG nucleotide pyrophosphohydrolase domain-containing protein [Planctomycetota bacterium]